MKVAFEPFQSMYFLLVLDINFFFFFGIKNMFLNFMTIFKVNILL